MAEEPCHFPFPGTPYLVQQQFMRELYSTLSYCKGGIFQSPTGTGKSLSIICAAFQWLRDERVTTTAPLYLAPSKVRECDSDSDTSITEDSSMRPSLPKIIYCSRTHSQLKQFVAEIQKTTFRQFKVVTLASRKKLCINQAAIDSGDTRKYCEAHRPVKPDALQPTCIYYQNSEQVTDYALSSITDIEDIWRYGVKCSGCPYYGTMRALEHADVILAPYPYLLNVRILQQIQLVDEQTVIIFDEAHNVIDNILDSNSYEKEVSKFEAVLPTLESIEKCFHPNPIFPQEQQIQETERLEAETHPLRRDALYSHQAIQNILTYINRSPLANLDSIAKPPLEFLANTSLPIETLQQLVDRMLNYNWEAWGSVIDEKAVKRMKSALRFLAMISMHPEDHAVILRGQNGKVHTIKNLLVNPIRVFSQLLASARSVILAGGTLEPMSEFLQLFQSLPRHLLRICDCNHVIPPENMEMFILKRHNQVDLSLTYDNKNQPGRLEAIAMVLLRLCEVVPHGIVCFFSSFDHMNRFVKHIQEIKIYNQIKAFKTIFVDQRKNNTFDFFEEKAKESGAILFTVVRGSLSEGINFKGDIGRCAVIIGQPFPNPQDAELKEKSKFWDNSGGEMTGAQYVKNTCFKAVNQCIGRVIRDNRDYAVVVLIDGRYNNGALASVSAWAKRNLRTNIELEDIVRRIRGFFEGRMEVGD